MILAASIFYFFDQAKKDKYDKLASELMCYCHIINNSQSIKTRKYLREEYIVNQSNYLDIVVETVAMITLFGNDNVDRDKGNTNMNKVLEVIASIYT